MNRPLRTGALIIAMLWAQWALAMHGVEHQPFGAQHDEACVQCLALAGSASAPPPAHGMPAAMTAAAPMLMAGVSPRLTFPHPAWFRTRAPPIFRS